MPAKWPFCAASKKALQGRFGLRDPSLESKARAMRGVYGYAEMKHRVNEKAMPLHPIVDLTDRANSHEKEQQTLDAFA
jgi:primosomal protein N'